MIFFTDGPAIPDVGCGAAAVTNFHVHKVSFGPLEGISNFEAEIMGLSLALLHSKSFMDIDRIAIFSDSQCALRVLHQLPQARSGQHLALGLRELAATLPPTLTILLFWSPGHEGITLNEKADVAATAAAKEQDNPVLLSISLGSLIPRIKQAYNIRNLTYDPRHPFLLSQPQEVADALSKLEKGEASPIFQLRSGHCPLNAYLHRFKRHDTGSCDTCMVPELVEHFLL